MGSSATAQLQFAAEFASFLAAAAGTALVALRPELLTAGRRRVVLFAGMVLLTAAAFLHGSLLVGETSSPLLVALRITGVMLAAAGVGGIRGPGWWRPVLMAGLAVTLAGAVVGAIASGSVAPSVLIGVGAVAEATALLRASIPSVAARVAATAAVTLLMVVLVLAVALSEVLSSTVRAEAFRRLDGRAATETNELTSKAKDEVLHANVVRASVQGINAAAAADSGGDLGPLRTELELLGRQFFTSDTLVWITTTGSVAASANLHGDPALATFLAASPLVRRAQQGASVPVGVVAYGGRLLAVAAYPNLVGDNRQVVGIAMAATAISQSDLDDAVKGDPAVGLAIADRSSVLLAAGPVAHARDLISVAAPLTNPQAGEFVAVGTRESSNLLLDARPVVGPSGTTTVAVVAFTSRSSVDGTRNSLLRTLFLIALGGTLLALLVSALVGEQVGAGLRALTNAAARIRRGETGVRTGVHSEDEVGVLGAAFDSMAGSIEEQAEALRQAAEEEAQLRNRVERIVAGMGEALIATAANGDITDWNPAAERLLGLPKDQALGRRVSALLKLRDEEGRDLVRNLRPGLSWSGLAAAETLSGPVPVAVSAAPVLGPDGETAGSVVLVRDVRREREVERMKTEFLSRIGHELRTPLAVVMGYANLMAHRDLQAPQMKGFAEEIVAQARRLQRIIEMLEFFASSGAGRVILRPERVDLRTVVRDAANARSSPEARISVTSARTTPEVVADPRWLTTAIDELLDNALKFSPRPARVAIRIGPTDDGRAVSIAIGDKGKGMSADEQARAFGEFVQGDSSDTREFGGLGLGLPLVQQVVEGQGGTITCTSEIGRGSTFTIELPVAVEAPAD